MSRRAAAACGAAQLYRAKPDGYTIGILNIPGMFILQQAQGDRLGAYDPRQIHLDRYAMGEGERWRSSPTGMNSPLLKTSPM